MNVLIRPSNHRAPEDFSCGIPQSDPPQGSRWTVLLLPHRASRRPVGSKVLMSREGGLAGQCKQRRGRRVIVKQHSKLLKQMPTTQRSFVAVEIFLTQQINSLIISVTVVLPQNYEGRMIFR